MAVTAQRLTDHDHTNGAVPNAIIINAFSRGGSNILWNIMQSHPRVCSPILETGQLLRHHLFRRVRFPLGMLQHHRVARTAVGAPLRTFVRMYLNHWKMKTLDHPDNRTKEPNVLYTRAEVQESVLCLKSLDQDIVYSDAIQHMYSDAPCLCLVRNGYALCNGWMRRGLSPEAAGKRYASVCERMLALCDENCRSVLVRFEDLLEDPFGVAERLFRHCNLAPARLPQLRLKSKRVLSSDGRHDTRFGAENRKYWFSRDEIMSVLDRGVNVVQADLLDDEARAAFDYYAGDVMRRLEYA